MTYNEIIDLSITYSNRTDSDTSLNMDNFLKIVEARINTKLKVMDMSSSGSIVISSESDEYDLPNDYDGLRHVFLQRGAIKILMHYANPLFITGIFNKKVDKLYYTIINNKIRFSEDLEIGDDIQLDYYRRVPNLSTSNSNNWVSVNHPNCYVFGLLVEINSLAKDAEAAAIWDDRFKESIGDIDFTDSVNKYNGQTLVTRLG